MKHSEIDLRYTMTFSQCVHGMYDEKMEAVYRKCSQNALFEEDSESTYYKYGGYFMKDNELQGNEKIEEAIAALQQEPTQEMLAHTLTVIRRRMQEKGQFVIAVEPPTGDNQLKLQAITTDDGKLWWMAFTSFEEELKGSNGVMSTFMTDIKQLFTSALQADAISGIILNPWNRTIMLDKNLIQITLGL